MLEVPAIRIVQKGLGEEGTHVTIYITALTLVQLREYAVVDRWSPDNPQGYQRPPEPRRIRQIARYVTDQHGILPTSVLVGMRTDDSPPIEAEGFGDEAISLGKLIIPDGAKAWLIDGQHRYSGVNDAYERGQSALAEYAFPVSFMAGIDRYTEMVHFNIINTEQKKMSTDIVDRHLVQIQEKAGLQMVAAGKGVTGEKNYMRATATRLVDKLNEEPGPWHHQIAIPGVPGRDTGLVRQHAVVTALEPFLKDPWVRGRTDDDKVKILVNFWAAAADAWPEAFEHPSEYRVQATAGVYSLHMVLPVLIQRCLEERDLTKENMTAILKDTGIDSVFWHKTQGDPLTLGTGMSSIRALAHTIVERLAESKQESVRL